jgi:tRNA pseudouridine(38-40) synthase
MEHAPDEHVLFEGHPSWRSILSHYIKGGLASAVVAVVVYFISGTEAAAATFAGLHWRGPLDRDSLDTCAALVAGSHDFTAFTPTDGYHHHFTRTVTRAEWLDEEEEVIAFWIEADSFLRGMVRALAGTMLDVGKGRTSVAEFERLVTGRPREEAGDTAAAHGLYLEAVRY